VYIYEIVQISRTEVATDYLHEKHSLSQFDLCLFPNVSLSFCEPVIEMVASFKEDNDAYEEEDEKVVEEELGMVLQRFEAVNAKVDGIGSYQ
jgi:hypothetical protein